MTAHDDLNSELGHDEQDEHHYSRNNYTYQWLEKVDGDILRELLNELPQRDIHIVTSRVHVRSLSAGRITLQQTELIRSATLKLFAAGAVGLVCHILVKEVNARTEVLLGDNYDNPTARQVRKLTKTLLEEFGPIKTKVFYGGAIDGEVSASRHLLKELSRRPELEIELYVHDDSKVNVPEPKPGPTETIKQSRREHRRSARDSRAARRAQNEASRRQKKLYRSSRPKSVESISSSDDENQAKIVAPSQIALVKLRHPHLNRYRRASTDHPDVGTVKGAFVSFGKDNPSEGKFRPCVIVAVGPHYCIVRPIYSHVSHFAGRWKAVVLDDWKDAGLDHESVVGHKTHKVKREAFGRPIGKLSINDWNRVCRGEVNNKSSLGLH